MANRTLLPLAMAQVVADERKTALANSVLHCFKSTFTPSVDTTLVEMTAQEAAFDGYAPITIAAWTGPHLSPGVGWMILGGQQVFVWTFAAGVTDTIGGTYLVSAGGDLCDITIFDPAQPMQGPGQVVIANPFELIAAG